MNSLEGSITRLNDKQKAAVLTTEGPLLIAAGAGSGKTRVLTHRIAHLIAEELAAPWNILAITFTNKAAQEMRERVSGLVGTEAESIWVSTFHAMCARILRNNAEAIGYEGNFSIIDQSEQQTLMKQILKELNMDSQRFNYKDFLSVIDSAKNLGQLPDDFAANAQGYMGDIQANIYRTYQRKLKQSNALDFNDLILLSVKLFQEREDILNFYQRKFKYIHVDEYQDTNESQYLLVRLLAGHWRNICVVGDADQSIYGWRGANMENILNFQKNYPDAKVILLEQNYRSTQNILSAANSVIANNKKRNDKKLWSDKNQGDKVRYYVAETDLEEARHVVQQIINLKQDGQASLKDFAILYRTQAQSRSLEEQLLKVNLPYRVVGGLKFYSRKEIQDTLAYLRLIDNPTDNLSFNRIVNVPKRGIGPTSVLKLAEFADSLNLSWFEAIDQLHVSNLSRSLITKFTQFAHMIQRLQEQAEFLTVSDMVEEIWSQSDYRQSLVEEGSLEAQNRLENLAEFASVTKIFDSQSLEDLVEKDPDLLSATDESLSGHSPRVRLRAFLTDISLVTDTQDEESDEVVTLMTMHAAKGLEFPYVFIVGMEEGLFPLRRSLENDDDLEEERRLAYVGMTRAEEKLFLSGSRNRLLYGRYQQNLPSRFIDEIDQNLIEKQGHSFQQVLRGQAENQAFRSQGKQQAKRDAAKVLLNNKNYARNRHSVIDRQQTTKNDVNWQVGDKVDHRSWGVGTIVQITKTGSDMMLSVAFDSQGIKQLLAAFAPINKI